MGHFERMADEQESKVYDAIAEICRASEIVKENLQLKSQLESAQKMGKEKDEALREAEMFISADYIDWDKSNSTHPDYDPNYKVEFLPPVVEMIQKAISSECGKDYCKHSEIEFLWCSPETPPKLTGRYVVVLHNDDMEIIECTENGYEYSDGLADPDEWKAWAEIPKGRITASYVPQSSLTASEAEVERLKGELKKLDDPVAVHVNMLRGTIAVPAPNILLSLAGPKYQAAEMRAESAEAKCKETQHKNEELSELVESAWYEGLKLGHSTDNYFPDEWWPKSKAFKSLTQKEN